MKPTRSQVPFPPSQVHHDRSKYKRRKVDVDDDVEITVFERKLSEVLRRLDHADNAGHEEASIRLSLEADGLRRRIHDLMREKAT